ncbi:enkurin-like [Nerophis lumbriciformis]|uniref:enkurin-like n=1 Tax=Nerophis lumbriciformis TaxID=546530 RepID=UPI002AE096FA|nr:enkurin-like [Nerophis lumbriciformis]XP_061817704.1 enkurin-like [Nerophis lumbriciformis]
MAAEMCPQETIPIFIDKNVVMERPQRFVSNSQPNGKMMGPTIVELQHSDNFVKKHSKDPKLPEIKQHVRNVYCTCTKPMLSAGTFLLPAGLPAKRMFTATPKVSKPPLCIVDTNKGHKEYHNKFSGLVPVYVKKKDYGVIPAYLLRRKGHITKSPQSNSEGKQEESEIEIEIENLTDAECREIIEDLKKKCSRLNTAYQRLPFVIDTPLLKTRKTRLEGDMQQLENDLKLLETLVSNK